MRCAPNFLICCFTLILFVGESATDKRPGLYGEHSVARSCFGHPKLGTCMYNNMDCTTNLSNRIMINGIVYTTRTCRDHEIKDHCTRSERCCDDPTGYRVMKPPEKNQWDFEVYSECSGLAECYHNVRRLQDRVHMSVAFQCIEEQKIIHFCENRYMVGNQIHIMYDRERSSVHTKSNCTCRVIASPGENLKRYNIDIRLQKNWQTMSSRRYTIAHQCSESSLYSGPDDRIRCEPSKLTFSTLMSSKNVPTSHLDLTLTDLARDFLDNPMMVWLAVEGVNNTDVKVVCGSPNVYPDISWLPDSEKSTSLTTNTMTFIIVGSAVFGSLVILWCCGCVYSRCRNRRNYDTDDEKVDSRKQEEVCEFTIVVPMSNGNEQQTHPKEYGLTVLCPNHSSESLNNHTETCSLINPNEESVDIVDQEDRNEVASSPTPNEISDNHPDIIRTGNGTGLNKMDNHKIEKT